MNLSDIDIYDLDKWATTGVPHEEFKLLRHECPVFFHDYPKGKGFWTITKHEDIVHVSKNPRLFSSHRGGTNLDDYEDEDLSQIQMLMVNMDPPQHAKYRKLVSKGFTPRMVRQMEPKIRNTVDQILTRVAPMGSCDFVREVAAELPLIVIADLMGIPQEDRTKLFDWSNRLIGFDDPEFQTNIEDARMAAFELWMYANSLAEERKGTEGTDLIRVLMNAEVDGMQLEEGEFDAFFLLLAVAGNETTRNALSGGLLALLDNPDQLELLHAQPELIPSAVEEILRWVTPVLHFRRTATADTEIRGQAIQEGDKLGIFYISANRDEEIFDNPYSFDITRDPNHHLAFGVG
ncbi:MAG: cytochrome P450, partial [Myxococcota bacterium]